MYFNLIQIIFYIDDICLLISMIFISVLLSVQVIARCLQASMVSERLVIGQWMVNVWSIRVIQSLVGIIISQ